jgi:hypothetical protein
MYKTKLLYLFVFLSIIYSCVDREEQLLETEIPNISYEEAYPENGATDVAIQPHNLGFRTWGYTQHFVDQDVLFEAYFGTTNPPKIKVDADPSFNTPSTIGVLSPNTSYYWKVQSTYPERCESEVQRFTSSKFTGNWELYALADKRELPKYLKENRYGYMKFFWADWNYWDKGNYYWDNSRLKKTYDTTTDDLITENID